MCRPTPTNVHTIISENIKRLPWRTPQGTLILFHSKGSIWIQAIRVDIAISSSEEKTDSSFYLQSIPTLQLY